jgi:hypothetical protein
MLVMSEDFVPYEPLCKLREKGYKCKYIRFEGHIYDVLKWLREEKKLYIEIYMHHNCYLWEIYNTKIYDDVDFDQKSEKYSELEYETYELAALAGIEYVIDNLI